MPMSTWLDRPFVSERLVTFRGDVSIVSSGNNPTQMTMIGREGRGVEGA